MPFKCGAFANRSPLEADVSERYPLLRRLRFVRMTGAAQSGLVALIAATLVVPIFARVRHGRLGIFDPYVWFALPYGVMFVIRPIHMMISGDFLFQAPLSVVDVKSGFTKMLVAAAIGAVGFVVGYLSPLGRAASRRLSPSRDRSPRWSMTAAAFVGGIAVAAFAVVIIDAGGAKAVDLLVRGRTPELTRALAEVSFYPWSLTLMLIPASLAFLALALEQRSLRAAAAFTLLAGVILLRAVPVGDRAVLLTFVGAVIVFAYLRTSRRPQPLVVVVAALCALTVSATLSDLRGRSTRNQSTAEAIRDLARHPTKVTSYVVSGPDSEMAVALAASMQVIPRKLGYTYGATTAGDLVRRPIPHVLWPGKGEEPRQRLIGTIWPAEHRRKSLSPEFSILLYPFWDFGYAGVAVALAAFGICARWLREIVEDRPGDLLVELLLAMSLWLIVGAVRNNPVDTLVTVIFTLLPLFVIFARFPRSALVGLGPRTTRPGSILTRS